MDGRMAGVFEKAAAGRLVHPIATSLSPEMRMNVGRAHGPITVYKQRTHIHAYIYTFSDSV